MITVPTEQRSEVPSGAPFIIDKCPFKPGEQFDYAMLDLEEDKIVDWPMVYILANDTEAYVGQTTSVAKRMGQHGANEEKSIFDTANIIFNEEFNVSVITDYEHRLIDYMHADGRYRLTNKNDGMTNSNYFSKAVYSEMFEELWDELRNLELADHTVDEIEESEVFKYSPFKRLNADQRVALDKIKAAIDKGLDRAAPIVVEGMPGTGKTILAIYLLKMLRDDERYKDLNIRIIEPVTSLRKTLQRSLRYVPGISSDDVIAPSDLAKPKLGYTSDGSASFDIALVDESHKLKQRKNLGTQFRNYDNVNSKLGLEKEATQVDWVINQAKLPIFFYDPLQSIGPSCVGGAAMDALIDSCAIEPIRLESQMRVKGGDEYLSYILDVLNGSCDDALSFPHYDLVLHVSFDGFVTSFEQKLKEHDLSRFVAGYAWKWISKKDKTARDIVIDGIGLRWNCTYEDWVGRGVDNPEIAHEVGCIHSIQGYDLSYAYVIIGDDLTLDPETGKLVSDRSSYFDRNGFATATKEELDQYIKNIYYVLLTRGILGTHIYVANPILREYFAQYFPVVE